jgi:hypothetical protein
MRDRDRIDWLFGHYGQFVRRVWSGGPDPVVTIRWTAFDRFGNSEKRETTASPGFRDAIDKASEESAVAIESEHFV